MNEATIDSVLLAAIEQFEDQATNRLLTAALEEYEDSGTTQKEDVKKCESCSVLSHITHLDTKYLMVKTLAGKPVPGSVLIIKYT